LNFPQESPLTESSEESVAVAPLISIDVKMETQSLRLPQERKKPTKEKGRKMPVRVFRDFAIVDMANNEFFKLPDHLEDGKSMLKRTLHVTGIPYAHMANVNVMELEEFLPGERVQTRVLEFSVNFYDGTTIDR
jgi:hypothetical protein